MCIKRLILGATQFRRKRIPKLYTLIRNKFYFIVCRENKPKRGLTHVVIVRIHLCITCFLSRLLNRQGMLFVLTSNMNFPSSHLYALSKSLKLSFPKIGLECSLFLKVSYSNCVSQGNTNVLNLRSKHQDIFLEFLYFDHVTSRLK